MDSEQIRKQNEVIHRYTPHQVWSKIGTSVAAGQYELPESEFHGCFLFMDVKGFTSYSEEHGPSDVVAALNGIFKPATEAIYSCGGDVDKFIGDCIFAVFGKAEEALAAGRKLLELFNGLKAKGSPFTVRVGINMGRAVRANVGSADRREYTFIGDAVNTAQRLEANCTPGKLLVCEGLCKLGAGMFSAAERREIQAKGKKNAVVAYELSL
jgi:adenylate cyclase